RVLAQQVPTVDSLLKGPAMGIVPPLRIGAGDVVVPLRGPDSRPDEESLIRQHQQNYQSSQETAQASAKPAGGQPASEPMSAESQGQIEALKKELPSYQTSDKSNLSQVVDEAKANLKSHGPTRVEDQGVAGDSSIKRNAQGVPEFSLYTTK